MWPKAEDLQNSLPMSFRKKFSRVCSIVDCFEIRVEKPHIPKEQAATYSSYKSMNTIKYLISITPQGTVSYISQGFAGRVSDQHIIRVSGYLEFLEAGDCVMADRGFIVKDVALRGPSLVTLAFLDKRDQLDAVETEASRQVANVRIHVERIIGSLKLRYKILSGPINHCFVRNHKDETVCFFDKVVKVCCTLLNLAPSVVPSGS